MLHLFSKLGVPHFPSILLIFIFTLHQSLAWESAGIGIELENPGFLETYHHDQCALADTRALKGQTISIQQNDAMTAKTGTNWKLTADTSPDVAGFVTLEYILDGQNIKVGYNQLSGVVANVVSNIMSLPLGDEARRGQSTAHYYVGTSPCNPFFVREVSCKINNAKAAIQYTDIQKRGLDRSAILWEPQVTAAMPFEALWYMLRKAVRRSSDHQLWDMLLTYSTAARSVFIYVTKDFFQDEPNGIRWTDIEKKKDVLGFLSILLMTAKSAHAMTDRGAGPKKYLPFVPATEWAYMFASIRGRLPGRGSLYDLVDTLACYSNRADGSVVMDNRYCSRSTFRNRLRIGDTLDKQKWTFPKPGGGHKSLYVKAWIQGIEQGDSPDGLTLKDRQYYDGSIGKFGDRLEYVMGSTTRAVPIWEFRGLTERTTAELQTYVPYMEQAVIDLHTMYRNIPS